MFGTSLVKCTGNLFSIYVVNKKALRLPLTETGLLATVFPAAPYRLELIRYSSNFS
jgi:hypothetical protein